MSYLRLSQGHTMRSSASESGVGHTASHETYGQDIQPDRTYTKYRHDERLACILGNVEEELKRPSTSKYATGRTRPGDRVTKEINVTIS